MFWRFGGYAGVSAVDSLLDKPDVSLEEILDEPEVIQELTQKNNKLIEYLREDHILKRLMDYVTAPSLVNEDDDDGNDDTNEPSGDKTSADDDQKTEGQKEEEKEDKKTPDLLKEALDPEDLERAEGNRLRHAYIACELLASETWSILESIMLNQDHLRDFWGFLKRPPALDPLQASYFTKVNETLLDHKTEEMLAFIRSLDGAVPSILQHIDSPMIMDLLLKIISLEKIEGGQGTVDWLKSQGLIPTLLSFLSPEYPATVQTSSGDFIKAIITISANAIQNDQSCIGPNSLTRQLVSAPCVESLIKPMLQGGNPLTVGVGIIIEVIRKNNSDYDPPGINGPGTMPSTYDPIYLGTLLRMFAQHIPDFMALIRSSKHTVNDGGEVKSVERETFASPWGGKVEPLGFDRFKTCELMAELLHCSNMKFLNRPGIDEYIWHRDMERERLLREGALHIGEGYSGAEFNDSADFVNGSSMLGSGQDDAKTLEVTNASEEDGFENVSAPKDGKPQEPKPEESNKTQDSTPAVDPTSPTVTDLTEKLSDIKIDKSEESKEFTTTTTTTTGAGESTTGSVPSHPEDVPAPLFAAAKQPTEQGSGEAGEAAAEKPQEQTQAGEEQKLHPDVQVDVNGQPVVGDYLKIMFVENRVVPTILVCSPLYLFFEV